MLRKIIITALTLTASFLAFLWLASYSPWPSINTKELSPTVDFSHFKRSWSVNFASDSPIGQYNILQLKDGKLTYIRLVSINNKQNLSRKLKLNYSLFGYVFLYGITTNSSNQQPNSLRNLLIVKAPIFPVFLLVAVYPAVVFYRGPFHRWRLKRKGLYGFTICSKCEYNLTGNVSGICPECGTEVKG